MNVIRMLMSTPVLALLACGGGAASSPGPSAGGGPTCSDAAQALTGHMKASGAEFTDEQLAQISERMTTVCTDSAWSDATRSCFAKAADEQATRACAEGFSPEQRDAFMGAFPEAGPGGEGGEGGEGDEPAAP
jgi:hypothetical protein